MGMRRRDILIRLFRMISGRMPRPVKVLLLAGATLAIAALSSACGTQRIRVPKSSPNYAGAVLFSQRCSGCHTLIAAATHGSASNIKTRLIENGPNLNTRCQRPASLVLYAIENGGDSGATMPQNIVVGQQAREVAMFVATYAGDRSATPVGELPCDKRPLGTLPVAGATPVNMTTSTASTTPATTTEAGAGKKAGKGKTAAAKASKKAKHHK